jgi:hypothetical protein
MTWLPESAKSLASRTAMRPVPKMPIVVFMSCIFLISYLLLLRKTTCHSLLRMQTRQTGLSCQGAG